MRLVLRVPRVHKACLASPEASVAPVRLVRQAPRRRFLEQQEPLVLLVASAVLERQEPLVLLVASAVWEQQEPLALLAESVVLERPERPALLAESVVLERPVFFRRVKWRSSCRTTR